MTGAELRNDTEAFIVIATLPRMDLMPRFQSDPDPDVTEARVNQFNEAILRQAAAHGVPIADMRPVSVDANFTTEDGFHPNDAGYRLIADQFLKVIEPHFFP